MSSPRSFAFPRVRTRGSVVSISASHVRVRRAWASRRQARLRAGGRKLRPPPRRADARARARRLPGHPALGRGGRGGKGEIVNLLLEWMDPRHVQVHALGAPTDEERARPPMWRFWRALPPKGKTGVFFGSWYTAPIVDRVYGRIRRRRAHAARCPRSRASSACSSTRARSS